jgi:hypothetical protein
VDSTTAAIIVEEIALQVLGYEDAFDAADVDAETLAEYSELTGDPLTADQAQRGLCEWFELEGVWC